MSKSSLVIASTLSLDYETMEGDHRYKDTRTTRPIYSIGSAYYATGKTAPKDVVGKPWGKANDQFWAERSDTILWKSFVDFG